ncbi:MerR family transcriptional regulator [Kitasatospora sp. NPDC096147]|uniref:MerR family transcriptional regulator n=1 Tax=Kitasatospora sp. NPDC096147 TaxID=3364093 RepID=UPI00380C20C8
MRDRQTGPPENASPEPSDGSGTGLPTGAVARRLGVSPTTVRSWERRYGLGPAERAPGHHRRWSPADIETLAAMCALTARGVPPGEAARAVLAERANPLTGTATAVSATPATGAAAAAAVAAADAVVVPDAPLPAPAPPPPDDHRALRAGAVRPECRGLTRAAMRLDSAEVATILRETVEALGVVEAWTEVMMPALRAAGRKWATSGEQYVEVEHLLSWHVSTILRTEAVRPGRPRPVPPVLLAAMPDEQHTLPLEAVAAGLTARRIPFRMLGAAVPPRALLDALERTGPAAVMLWSQHPTTADTHLVRRVTATAWGPRGSRTHALVLATGPGWHRGDHPDGTASPRTLPAALDLLERSLG